MSSDSLMDEAICFGLSSWEGLLLLSACALSCSVFSFLLVAFAAPFRHETFLFMLVVITVATDCGWLDLLPFMPVVTTVYGCLHMAQPTA